MKANELMLRDWVNYDSVPSQVIMMSLKRVMMVLKEKQIVYINSERLKPIPLTDEILMANGWKAEKDEDLYYLSLKGLCYFEWRPLDGTLFISENMLPLPVQFVHQMQHALRLCGRGDLADNFKIY